MIKKNNSSLTQIEDIFIETVGDLAGSLSINPVVGQLYALLYIRPAPVSLDEMTEKLKTSKGNASINIRILENWQAVKKVLIKGSRKDYYTAETDFLKIITNRINEGLTRRLAATAEPFEKIKTILSNSQSKFNSMDKSTVYFYKTKIKQLEEISNFVENVLKILPTLNLLKQKNNFSQLLVLLKSLKKL